MTSAELPDVSISAPAQEIAELLEAAIGHIAAVAGKNFWLRQIGRRSVFVRVPEDELARLQGAAPLVAMLVALGVGNASLDVPQAVRQQIVAKLRQAITR